VLSSLRNMFRIPDLRNKIMFTILMLAIYRLGSHIPVPGIDISALKTLERQAEQGGVLAFFQLFSGGALTNFAIFALGIMPYITSSIIIQILTVVIPKLEQWQQQGAVGQRKLTQATRYLTIAIAIVQSTGLAFVFHNGGAGFGAVQNPTNLDLFGGDQNFTLARVSLVVLTLVVGTALIMWMGELITQRGIGNGMSLIIFASVVSTLPGQGSALRSEEGNTVFALLMLFALVILVLIVIIENGQRRIPVQFAKRVVGRRMYGGQSTYIPLKVNQAGIIPIIFASSVLYLPLIITNVLPTGGWGDSVREFVDKNFGGGQTGSYGWPYVIVLALLVVGFSYFYTAIAFDPVRQADQIRKQGGFIPGIRPGPQTERYLAKVLSRITLPGALFIAVIAVLPVIMLTAFDVRNFPFAGTTVLIAVGVALETMKQIDSQLMMRNYEGFLK
jgi:preprotein translocase subunit SecY